MSLYNELILLLYKEIRLQSDKDSRRSTSRYVYTLSGFFFSIATKEAFWLMGSSFGYILNKSTTRRGNT